MKLKFLVASIVMIVTATAAMAEPREWRPPMAIPYKYSAKFDTSHSFDIRHYRLQLRPFLTSDSLHGQQTIAAVSRTAGLDTVFLHCVQLAVDSVKLNGVATGYRRPADSLLVGAGGMAQGQLFTIDVFYRGGNFADNNGGDSRGYYWYPKYSVTLRTTGYTCSAPQDARKWMPCFDEPWDKADSGCTFELTVPDTFVTAANGVLTDTVRNGNLLTWRWDETSAIATYLMAFHASQYAFWTDTAWTASGDTVPLLYFMWPPDSAKSRTAFATVPDMMECYTSRFGRYPFDKYAMAAVNPFIFGGMENQDMTTIAKSWIGTSDTFGIAHELSHMWFGDMVTCGTWADIWLNEGFGSYCEAIYDEHLTGRKPGVYMAATFGAALAGNANTYPIYDPPMPLIYDYSMEYAKAAWVLHMVRWVMGDNAFFPMMRAYTDSFAYGSAVTADFQWLAERSHGSGLQWFFDQWVYQAGHPIYTTVIYQRTHPDSCSARMTITQTSTTGDLYAMPVALACSTAAGRRDTVVWIDAALTGPIVFDEPGTIAGLRFDPDSWLLKARYDSVPRLRSITRGPHQLSLAWNQFTADPTPPYGYNVYRGLSVSGQYDRINADIVPDTSYLDAGLPNGIRYYYKVTAVCGADTCFETKPSNAMSDSATGVAGEPEPGPDPACLRLEAPSPTPFRRETAIRYQLPRPGPASLKVYNLSGQLVRTLVEGPQAAGRHTVRWDGRNHRGQPAAAGIYLAALEAEGRRLVRAVDLIR